MGKEVGGSGGGGEREFSVIDTYLTALKPLKQSPPLKRL